MRRLGYPPRRDVDRLERQLDVFDIRSEVILRVGVRAVLVLVLHHAVRLGGLIGARALPRLLSHVRPDERALVAHRDHLRAADV